MNQADFRAFSELLSGVADYYGKPLNPAAIQIYWAALDGIDLPVVRRLLSEHVKLSRFMPAVSEILDRVKVMDGRPGAEEAWAMLPKDESGSVVWTDEMAHAYGVCATLMVDDRIAARMAFREAYTQAVVKARSACTPANWTPSLGHDPHGRESVLIEAAKLGRLTRDHVAGLLPHRSVPPTEVLALLQPAA